MSALLDRTPHLVQPGAVDGPVILGLHGTGADERQGIELARLVAPGQPVLAPRGSVREGSAARWFSRHAEGVFDVDDVVARAAELADLVAAARSAYALEGRAILAVGFSNGANMALATTLLHPAVLPETLAFSARWPLGDREPAADLSGARITLLNGDADPMAPLADVERAVREAAARGADAVSRVRPGGHGLDARDLEAARGRIRPA
ncbi:MULTISPECIES: alpha/beta hydrolase [Clavibacter]|uniref:Carboxylesterase n=1 Tax=Clavibacter tessellarius TaxID=31965 RepID=A0A154V211_9MICO|nr:MULTISPECIES: carboxylesterase [Clavibacter]KZC95420.1 carboxylesterase [Clavibacter michiganensis subsp. tessellarius]MDA3803548.1 carboxylesterase [Clavibacter sp. CT19]